MRSWPCWCFRSFSSFFVSKLNNKLQIKDDNSISSVNLVSLRVYSLNSANTQRIQVKVTEVLLWGKNDLYFFLLWRLKYHKFSGFVSQNPPSQDNKLAFSLNVRLIKELRRRNSEVYNLAFCWRLQFFILNALQIIFLLLIGQIEEDIECLFSFFAFLLKAKYQINSFVQIGRDCIAFQGLPWNGYKIVRISRRPARQLNMIHLWSILLNAKVLPVNIYEHFGKSKKFRD